MLKVTRRSAGSASLTLLPFTVYAVGRMKKEDHGPVRVDRLSLYSVPHAESRFVEEPRSSLEEAISRLRKAAEPYASGCQALYHQTKTAVRDALGRGSARCEHLRNPPPEVVKSLSVIGLAGVLGYFLARRSKRKRLVYPVALMGVTSSVLYPKEAFRLAQRWGEKLCGWSSGIFMVIKDTWTSHFEKSEEVEPSFKQKSN